MTTKPATPSTAAKKKLHSRIAAAQKQADAAKKAAKLAKASFKHAKQRFKDAKRIAKKVRKAVKALKAELSALSVKKTRRKSAAAVKPASKRRLPAIQTPVQVDPVAIAPVPADITPDSPSS
jgi:chromosome segregation ATPase